MAELAAKYKSWTKLDLVQRLELVENELKRRDIDVDAELAARSAAAAAAAAATRAAQDEKGDKEENRPQSAKKARKSKQADIDPSRYSTRPIALKLAYLGKNYAGFEFQPFTELSTIEEELWKALTTARLIFPKDKREVDFSCCEYAKCGRTDRGVSAFGQVVSLRVRSNRPLPKPVAPENGDPAEGKGVEARAHEAEEAPFDDVKDEIGYVNILNKLLPPDIRILAWCPSPPPEFNARFSCRERRYRYFFTQPAFPPLPSRFKPEGTNGWLDIEKMREAAKLFVGSRDFRNFCKIDPAKQITSYERVIYHADIAEVEDADSALTCLNFQGPEGMPAGRLPKVYSFDVWGSAFLWHQIRCMVSILFLVGQGLESPDLVRDMLDTEKTPHRTAYLMAAEVPLVLWDCIFPGENDPERKDALRWVYSGEESPTDAIGAMALRESVWATWREHKMDEVLAGQLFRYTNRLDPPDDPGPAPPEGAKIRPARPKVFEGGNNGRPSGKYVPVAKMRKMLPPDEQNDIYARKMGFASAEEMRSQENWRQAIREVKASARDTRTTKTKKGLDNALD